MVEPWVTPWSRLIYGSLHHEPFDPDASTWIGTPGRPLSEANGALPWIVFERDRKKFTSDFPGLRLHSIRPIMPLRYLLSGGVSIRQLMPDWTYRFWSRIDRRLVRISTATAMFAVIVVRRTEEP